MLSASKKIRWSVIEIQLMRTSVQANAKQRIVVSTVADEIKEIAAQLQRVKTQKSLRKS